MTSIVTYHYLTLLMILSNWQVSRPTTVCMEQSRLWRQKQMYGTVAWNWLSMDALDNFTRTSALDQLHVILGLSL